jgi:fatty acid desaturase
LAFASALALASVWGLALAGALVFVPVLAFVLLLVFVVFVFFFFTDIGLPFPAIVPRQRARSSGAALRAITPQCRGQLA